MDAVSSYTISGNAGIAGATLNWFDGVASSTVADANGDYSFMVTPDWSGTVTPTLSGYFFTPTKITYPPVTADQVNQDYTATASSYVIIGNTGVGEVLLSWTDGVTKTMTSSFDGDYTITVPYNWSGTVTPSKAGYTFNPVEYTYTNLNSNQNPKDYVATTGYIYHFRKHRYVRCYIKLDR